MNYIKQVVIKLLLKQLRTNVIQNKKINKIELNRCIVTTRDTCTNVHR